MKIGKNTFVHPTAVIGEFVTIGDDCYIGPLCIIGYPAEWKNMEHNDCGVLIGSGTRLTGAVTIDAGTKEPTIIGSDCYLMKHSHVGHDAVISNDVTISCGAKIGGHVKVGAFTNIGLNAVIHQRCEVPEGCMIGASAFVGKRTKMIPNSKYAGVPAKYIGPNIIS